MTLMAVWCKQEVEFRQQQFLATAVAADAASAPGEQVGCSPLFNTVTHRHSLHFMSVPVFALHPSQLCVWLL